MRNDFRADAAAATLANLKSAGINSLAASPDSGCLFVGGLRAIRLSLEVATLAIILICGLLFLASCYLSITGVISYPVWVAGSLAVLSLVMVLRKLKGLALRVILSRRSGGFLREFPNLPQRPVGIEDGATHEQTKLLIEDEGVCLLDAERRRILIEGCQYRHVIYGKDVMRVEAISRYAFSGVHVTCRMAGHQVDMAIITSGHGPLSSLVQAFAPRSQAVSLATTIYHTLFGDATGSTPPVRTVPPPLPR